jgi:LysM repeat protein
MLLKRLLQVCVILVLLLTSLASTGSARAWSGCGGSYVVQHGDWLAKIAQNCGVTLSAMYAANPWANYQYYIYPGQVLVIPGTYDGGYNSGGTGGSCGPSYDVYGSYWVVCRGDTLGSIARYYGVGWRYLQQINDIWNPNLIYAGQVIRL